MRNHDRYLFPIAFLVFTIFLAGCKNEVKLNGGGQIAAPTADLALDQLKNSSSASPVSTAGCNSTQTMYYDAGTKSLLCQTIAGAWTESGSDIYRPTGRVGIGTSSPSHLLDLKAAAASTPSVYFANNDFNGTSVGSALAFNLNAPSGNTPATIQALNAGGSTGGNLILNPAGGLIGVGTTPNYKFSVYEAVTDTPLDLRTGSFISAPVFTAASSRGVIGVYGVVLPNVTSGTVSGILRGGAFGANVLNGLGGGTISNLNGVTIGIGINAGGAGTITNAYGINISQAAQAGTITNLYGIYIDQPTTGGALTNEFGLYQRSTAARNYFAGTLGVGTTSPSEKLHVVGNLRVQGSTDCTLGNGSGGTSCSSDARLKTNIVEIDSPLQRLLAIRGVNFNWNERSPNPGQPAMGLIAQEVERQFPTAVSENTATGYKQIDYAVLVAPLIQALKSIHQDLTAVTAWSDSARESLRAARAEAAETKARLRSLSSTVEEQRREIELLKGYLCRQPSRPAFCS